MRYTNVLLGATDNHELVFTDFEITQRNGYNEFSASFDTVLPFDSESIDLTERYSYLVDDMDKEWLVHACDNYDCKPSELADVMANSCGDVSEIVDCSLYPEFYMVDGVKWYFESVCCGQHDTSGEIKEFVNEDAYLKLYDIWKNYHLKEITPDIENQVNDIAEALSGVDEKEWIVDYIIRNIDYLR